MKFTHEDVHEREEKTYGGRRNASRKRKEGCARRKTSVRTSYSLLFHDDEQ